MANRNGLAAHSRSERRRCRFGRGAWAALAAALISSLLPAAASVDAADERTWHVSTAGSDDGSGDVDDPVRTITAAVGRARSGDTVLIAGGTYRESVDVEDKELHIASAPGERATIDGTRRLNGFTRSGGAWYAAGWERQFSRVRGDMVGERYVAAYPDQVFFDDQPIEQVLSRIEVVPGTFFHDNDADRIWLGDDPRGRLVEASVRSTGIRLEGASRSSLTNVTVRRFATDEAEWAAIHVLANDVTVTGVISEFNAFNGLALRGDGNVVRDSRFSNNGYIGIHGERLDGVVIEDTAVVANNAESFDPLHSGSGLKLTRSKHVVIRGNDVSDNGGPGIWTDLQTSSVTIAGNRVVGNTRSGIEIELSSNVSVVDNTTIGNGEAGIWILESQNVNVWHNAAIDNAHEIDVLEGRRSEVRNVSVRNNIMGRSSDSLLALMSVDDWTAGRSAIDMRTSADHNLFWRASVGAGPFVSQWATWPDGLTKNSSVDDAVGHGEHSTDRIGDALPVRDASTGDYRGDSTVPLGLELSDSVAIALDVDRGKSLQIGPLSPAPTIVIDP